MAKPNSVTKFITGHTTLWGLVALGLLAAFFRGYQLGTLPPGLSGGEATLGLSALALLHHGTIPGFEAASGFAPLWVGLQSLAIGVFGHTSLALRIWPAIIGTASVLAVWLWAKDWFGPRVAWVAGVIMAVTPWAVMLGRSAGPAVVATLVVPLILFTGARAVTRNDAKWWWLTGVLFVVSLFSGPLGWMVAVLLAILGFIIIWRRRKTIFKGSSVGGLSLAVIGVAGAVIVAALSWSKLAQFASAASLSSSISTNISTVAKVAAMFNLHGDESFLHNFNGEPLFNAFVGLMFVAGLLFSLTRFQKPRYRTLVIAFAVLLLPALVSSVGAPNAAHAAAALPVAVVLAAVGVDYMLSLWYATFPINSAARSTGVAAILMLLALSIFQGYVQTFRAWSGSAETYQAYNEAATAAAAYLTTQTAPVTAKTVRILVATPSEQAVVAYLNYGRAYQAIDSAGIATVPQSGDGHQFVITAAMREDSTKQLAAKLPGGKLAPHYSTFSQNELFYDYETTQ